MASLPGVLVLPVCFYMTRAMKLPMAYAAWSRIRDLGPRPESEDEVLQRDDAFGLITTGEREWLPSTAAGKALWIKVYSGEFEDWLRNVDRLVQKYGSHSLFLMFPEMSHEQAVRLLAYADEHWSDVRGTFDGN